MRNFQHVKIWTLHKTMVVFLIKKEIAAYQGRLLLIVLLIEFLISDLVE